MIYLVRGRRNEGLFILFTLYMVAKYTNEKSYGLNSTF